MIIPLRILVQSTRYHVANYALSGFTASGGSSTAVCNLMKNERHPLKIFYRCRSGNIFNRMTADALWKSVISLSSAGKKKGRGRMKRTATDLNKGQVIGVGKINMVWPGLNAPMIMGKELIERKELPPDKDREEKLIQLRQKKAFRTLKLSRLERGWSGTKMTGRRIGPPDPIGDEKFEGFQTIVLSVDAIPAMSSNFGRIRTFRSFSITGNGNGLVGYALGKATTAQAAIRNSKNKAGQRLRYFERYEDRTLLYDFHSRFGNTKIFAKQKPKGYGLVCSRVIKAVCELAGITDMYAKIEGSTHTMHTVKSFCLGLHNQMTYQELANKKGLHLVEIRRERGNFPVVLASPDKCRNYIKPDEDVDLRSISFGGRVELRKKKRKPFYVRLPSYQRFLKKTALLKNQFQVKLRMTAEHGKLTSFLQLREEEKLKTKVNE